MASTINTYARGCAYLHLQEMLRALIASHLPHTHKIRTLYRTRECPLVECVRELVPTKTVLSLLENVAKEAPKQYGEFYGVMSFEE